MRCSKRLSCGVEGAANERRCGWIYQPKVCVQVKKTDFIFLMTSRGSCVSQRKLAAFAMAGQFKAYLCVASRTIGGA